jgi:cobalt/nickel transport protein
MFPLAAVLLALGAAPARAHFNMLLPDKASVKKDEAVTLTYQWGHPFEHELFDAPAPEKVWVTGPGGRTEDVTKSLEKTTLPAGDKTVNGYKLRYTPRERGDHTVVLQTPPIWLEADEEFVQDLVKVFVHVQADKGWERDAVFGSFDLIPLTRPYGLVPGCIFQAEVSLDGFPPGQARGQPKRVKAEIERYNAAPPKQLPPEEQMTRSVQTSRAGVLTGTLPEAGWWSITASRESGSRERDNKNYPLRQRATLWVFVDEKR